MSQATTSKSPVVSSRAEALPYSPIRKLAPFADAAKKRGTHVYHLNIGQPDLETPACMRERLQQINEVVYEYSPSAGIPEFIESLQHYYRKIAVELSAGEIIATTGGSEAILFALLACCDSGDELLVTEPFYANYAAFAGMAGVKLVTVPTHVEDGFRMPARDEWEKQLTPRTRVVMLCSPNNPTGAVYTEEELLDVARFCAERNLFLVVDEVYREFVYDGKKPFTTLSLTEFSDRVIVIDSLSKRYSACGIRLGCLVTRNRQVYDACLRMAQGRLSPPRLAQLIAIGAMSLGEEYTRDSVAEYQMRRDVLFEELSKISGLFVRKPEGAFYLIVRLPVKDSERFAQWLLSDFQRDGETVMVAPAQGFYSTAGAGSNEVRIAYVLKADALRRAVVLLREALIEYRSTVES